MELFVDSYDWVMVPNVYAMSQHADGGLITTKPYFSGSAYVKKMSNHPKGDWTATWDGLYWRWIWNHVDELGKNPRWAIDVRDGEEDGPGQAFRAPQARRRVPEPAVGIESAACGSGLAATPSWRGSA